MKYKISRITIRVEKPIMDKCIYISQTDFMTINEWVKRLMVIAVKEHELKYGEIDVSRIVDIDEGDGVDG